MSILTRDQILRLVAIDPDIQALWADVQVVADRLHASTGDEQGWVWQHLLLAVVNFKANLKLYPPRLPHPGTGHDVKRTDALTVAAGRGNVSIEAERSDTWQSLTREVAGMGVPRASAVLAALWPQHHVIIDWRSLSAAIALSGSRFGWETTPVDPASTRAVHASWDSYGWYRKVVLDTAGEEGLRLVQVERALYKLGSSSPGATWADYAAELESTLDRSAD